jgi:hypothetical protein
MAWDMEWVTPPVADRPIKELRNSDDIISECCSSQFLMWEGQHWPSPHIRQIWRKENNNDFIFGAESWTAADGRF